MIKFRPVNINCYYLPILD